MLDMPGNTERVIHLEARMAQMEALRTEVGDLKKEVNGLQRDLFVYTKVIPAVFAAFAAASAFWGLKMVPDEYKERLTKAGLDNAIADMDRISKFANDMQQTADNGGCTRIGGMQMCWGSVEVRARERHPENQEVISAQAKYTRPFQQQPSITTGIRTLTTDDSAGNGCTWGIYNSAPGTEAFNIAAILISRPADPTQCRNSRVTISYLAVGAPVPGFATAAGGAGNARGTPSITSAGASFGWKVGGVLVVALLGYAGYAVRKKFRPNDS